MFVRWCQVGWYLCVKYVSQHNGAAYRRATERVSNKAAEEASSMLADVLSVIASVTVIATCYFVARQTNEARKSRESLERQTAEAQKTRELMEADNAPFVRVYTDYDREQQRCCVRIKNFGKSPAKDITISPVQPWDTSVFISQEVPYALSGQWFTLEAGQELVPIVFQSVNFPGALSGQEVIVVYHEGTTELRRDKMTLNTNIFNGMGSWR